MFIVADVTSAVSREAREKTKPCVGMKIAQIPDAVQPSTRPRASPAGRRARELTLCEVAPTKHSASHDHEK